MKEQMGSQGTPEQIKKAEAKNLTVGDKEKSDEREATYNTGAKHGKHEVFILEKSQFEKEKNNFERELSVNKMADEFKLSTEVREYFLKGLAKYKDGDLTLLGATEEQLIAIIKELPVITSYEMCESPSLIITRDIVDELLKHEELKKVCDERYSTYSARGMMGETKMSLLDELDKALDDRRWKNYDKNKKGEIISKHRKVDLLEVAMETMPPLKNIHGAVERKKEIKQAEKIMTEEEREMSKKRKEIYDAGQNSSMREK